MDKQRDTVMLVLQFYIKKGYTYKKKKKGRKGEVKKPITMLI